MRVAAVAAAFLALLVATAPADARPPRVLVTGDSMMLLTDRYLKLDLERAGLATVRRDLRVSTGLSKPHVLDWPEHARRQVARRRPDVVIATLGANDGFPIRGARCCGARWTARYATRARRLLLAWSRAGGASVYWLTLPPPNDARLGRQFEAVNAAFARAALGVPGAAIVDLRPVIAPFGFQERMTIAGVDEQIRSDDGVHLWWPGARLAANVVLDRLRSDAVIG